MSGARWASRFVRWYGAGPLHLLALLASFSVAGYAGIRLGVSRPVAAAVWFVGAAVGHDLVLLPLYAVADRSLVALVRRRPPASPAVAWLNYVRVPAFLSGLLLLVWFPSIFRLSRVYRASTGLSSAGYLARWLLVTAVLFLVAGVALAVRMRRAERGAPR